MKDLFKTWIVETYIAHRGIHDENIAENSLSAFKRAIAKGYAIELDVQLISDGTVVVFHDKTLTRVANRDGFIKNLVKSDLKKIKLSNTSDFIPTFEEVLDLVDGKVPLLIEIKNDGKIGELESKTYDLLKDYNGKYAIESFNPFSVKWFKDNAPEIIRGQLSGYLKDENLSWLRKFALKRMVLNKNVMPDFIAYEAEALPNRFCNKYKKIPLLAWTVRSQEEYMKVIKYCDNIIFENFEPYI